jgi:hypothetical protein
MNTTTALLKRVDDIASALERDNDALALIGIGSVGQEMERLDAYSDLDLYIIVRPGAKARFLNNLAWLEAAAPIVFHFRGPRDGLHALFADGIHCELAVFTVAELAAVRYMPGRVVWKRPWVDDGLAQPALKPPDPRPRSIDMLVGEILWELYVGLLRFRRGERQAAVREIQRLAVDRLMDLAVHLEEAASVPADPFAPMRRFERRFPQMAAHLAAFQQGYERTPQSAAAILDFLAEHFPLNEAMTSQIRRLLADLSTS